jgi:hypothetical protein
MGKFLVLQGTLEKRLEVHLALCKKEDEDTRLLL